MGLFNQFKDTVFLKEDSNLEKQLNELKIIRNKLENTNEIDEDIRAIEYGIIGENEIAFELKNANIGMYVLRDVTFEYDNNKAQIDYLIFTRGYFYIVECKNISGNITVDYTGQFSREYEYNGKKTKEAIYSPYTQVERHHAVIKKICSANQSKISNLIFDNYNEKKAFKSIVVLAKSKSILNTKNAPKEIKNDIIRADQLISYIKKDIDTIEFYKLHGEKKLKKIAEEWLKKSVPNTTNMANKYLNKINEKNNKTIIENELRKFRNEKSKAMNIPPYYIYTDEELDKIISTMPKNVDELKTKRILSDIKIKYHGEEIINILNKEIKQYQHN